MARSNDDIVKPVKGECANRYNGQAHVTCHVWNNLYGHTRKRVLARGNDDIVKPNDNLYNFQIVFNGLVNW